MDKITFKRQWLEAIQKLPAEKQLEAYNAIMDYAFTGEVAEMDGMVEFFFFSVIKEEIDAELEKQRAISEKRRVAASVSHKRYSSVEKNGDEQMLANAANACKCKKTLANATEILQLQPKSCKCCPTIEQVESLLPAPLNPISLKEKKDSKESSKKKEQFDLSFVQEELKDVFLRFIDMRKKIKKPIMTQRAVSDRHKKLMRLSGGDIPLAIAIAEQSISYEWQDFYALKTEESKPPDKAVEYENDNYWPTQ